MRIKYLLGANSLVFYNYNSGLETNFWQEYWMNDKFFKQNYHYVAAKDLKELENLLNYYSQEKNDQDAQKIAQNGFNFFKKYLNPKQIEYFWNELLWEYKNRCNFEINEPLGNLFQENSYGD